MTGSAGWPRAASTWAATRTLAYHMTATATAPASPIRTAPSSRPAYDGLGPAPPGSTDRRAARSPVHYYAAHGAPSPAIRGQRRDDRLCSYDGARPARPASATIWPGAGARRRLDVHGRNPAGPDRARSPATTTLMPGPATMPSTAPTRPTGSTNTPPAAGHGAAFAYDANGNLTSTTVDGTTLHLRRREPAGAAARAATRAALRSARPAVPVSSGGAGTTRFLYDGDALVAEYDGAGAMTAPLRPRRRRRRAAGRAIEGAGARPAPRYLHADHQGSIVARRPTPTATAVAINAYDEYGIPGAANAGRFQYTGQIWLARARHVPLQGPDLLADAGPVPADRSDRV